MKKIKQILLITPPYHSGVVESAGTWLNVGLVTIAGALREQGFEVHYYDAMSLWHDQEQIRRQIEVQRPQVVAVTAITASYPAALGVLSAAKEMDSSIITVMGNVHPTFMWKEILEQHHGTVDYIVRGEGEKTLPELLQALKAGDDPLKVAGIACWRDGIALASPEHNFIEDLDRLPAAWDLVHWPIYSYRTKPGSTLAVVSSSRGCQQKCSFCSQQLFWKQTWRARSPENFVEELELLRNRYGVNVAMIADEIPTFDRQRWVQILDLLIERKLGLDLLMETRVDDILRDQDILPRYRQAGITHIYVGVEATNQVTLDMFKKELKLEDSRRAIELINQHDIISETSFVLGMPEDTPETIRATVELAKHYNPDMAFFLAIAPWPYAEIYPELKAHIVVHDYSQYNLVQPVAQPKNMTLEQLEAELGRASREFWLHKMRSLDSMPASKREFMLAVMQLLVDNSYLAEKMKGMENDAGMPEEVKKVLARIAGKKF